MLRTSGLALAWLTAVCASCLVMAQEPAATRKAPRVTLPKTLEQIARAARQRSAPGRALFPAPGRALFPAPGRAPFPAPERQKESRPNYRRR